MTCNTFFKHRSPPAFPQPAICNERESPREETNSHLWNSNHARAGTPAILWGFAGQRFLWPGARTHRSHPPPPPLRAFVLLVAVLCRRTGLRRGLKKEKRTPRGHAYRAFREAHRRNRDRRFQFFFFLAFPFPSSLSSADDSSERTRRVDFP